jgi:elongator complex protein 2
LASSSQDKRIRLWKIKTNSPSSATDTPSATQNLSQNLLLSKFAVTDNESMSIITMSQKGLMITLPKGESFSIILESVLVGHDDWVLGICWAMPQWQADTKKIHQPMSLVSASMDRTMILWEPEPSSGLWIEKVRVGDIGGNHLGFFGTAFGKDGRYLLAHGYNGAFHLWKSKPETDEWVPHVTVSGHFDEVRDISWDPTYHYLISVSKDQTSRLWAQWFRSEEYITKNTPNRLLSKVTWNEIARPQIHGHDLNCLSFINNRLHRFVSGAEEKVIRVFDAPRTFVDNLKNITNWKTEDNDFEKRPLTANVPPLGLSNKPIFDQKSSLEKSETESILEKLKASMSGDEGEFEGDAFDWEENKMNHPPLILQQPPFEEHLLQRTLWAEIEKLYGHGNEIISLSGSHSGDLLASSCKGTTADQSAIRIWCTTKWKEKCVLKAHTLTVTQMSWSHDDRYLLSISRDRCFCVSQIIRKGDDIEAKLLKRVKAHARILWGCDWAPDDKYFATASRDKKVKIWSSVTTNNSEVDWVQDSQLEFKHSVTAVAWAPLYFSAGSTKADGANTPPFNYILAVGLESGGLSLWSATSQFDDSAKKSTLRWTSFLQIETLHSHNETVRRIRWRLKPTDYPQVTENRLMAIAGTTLELATCSKDHSVRLFAVTIKS